MGDKKGWVQLTPETLAQMYSHQRNVSYTATVKRVIIDNLLNDLHEIQMGFIDEAVDKSDLREANEIIKHIMEKK